jgi:phosphoribosylanthranilate isomerase
MPVRTKICGINHPDTLAVAVEAGARFIGLVFYPRSPRAVSAETAAQLARMVPTGVRVVGLFVDPADDFLRHVIGMVPLDMIQLHGEEAPDRVGGIRHAYGIETMKAVKILDAADLDRAAAFEGAADWLLFDAKAPQGVASLPGGNGISFDWSLLTGRRWSRPWMLSGGLTPANVGDAIRATGATTVDVSSGVEDRPGHKDPDRIRRFLQAVSLN